jgi:phosphoenolpyruvate synthase/pyruvate phosphate dikinase
MPGMMETVLNVGLNDYSVNGLIKVSNNERFAWDSYRRLIQMFGKTVLDIDGEIFADALQARNFITNKLISLSDCGDPKLELRALELLGKHSDIGLFTERSEVTIHHKTSVALENSIKERVKRLLNADVTDIVPIDDLDAQLGTSIPLEDTQNEYGRAQNEYGQAQADE